MSPRGRRPAGSDARGDIVEAARAEFAERGYDAVSLRAIARRAGVDSALVHHYFDGKAELFAAVITLPVNPQVLIDAVLAVPREAVGEALARTFLLVWDSPEGRVRFAALIRSVLTHDEAARMVREFVVREIFARIALAHAPAGEDPAEAERRAGLAAGQLIGVAMLRYAVHLPALVDADPDALIADLAPTLQRYLAP